MSSYITYCITCGCWNLRLKLHESVSWYHQTNHHLILRFQHRLLYLAMRLRGENQQQVIEAMLKKFTKANVIKNYESIMNAVQGMFQTNMTTDEITALIQMQIDDMASWKVTSMSADGTGDMLPTYSFGNQPLYVMSLNEVSIKKIKIALSEN